MHDFISDGDTGFWMTVCGILLALLVVAAILFFWLGQKFKKQAAVIQRYQEESRKNRNGMQREEAAEGDSYARFFPREILERVMQKQPDGELLFTQSRMNCVNMFFNSNASFEMIHVMTTEKLFAFLNRMTTQTIPMIYQSGGVVERFEEVGMNVYFERQDKEALLCAISICTQLEELCRREKNEYYDSYSIGICLDHTMLGVAGDKNRASILSFSAGTPGFIRWLQKMAAKYYARIIVTEEYLDQLEDVQKQFHIRKLGAVWLQGMRCLQVIYDVYDGDPAGIRDMKRQTRMVFEEGVELYAKGKLEDARRHFVEVIKADENDRAARRYIKLCEEKGGRYQTADGSYCIEIF